MRILAFEAENFAKLRAVAIRPDGRLVEVTGRNRQGKTSVLNAIWVALAGKRVAPVEPIRDGEERARIVLTLGDEAPEFVVTRTFVAADNADGYTTALKVEGVQRGKLTAGQDVLDAMIGTLTFDPSVFIRSGDEGKLAMLRPLVPEVDFEALKATRKEHFDERTLQNRTAKERRAQADGIAIPPGPPPAAVDVEALQNEYDSAAEHNAKIAAISARRDAAKAEIDRLDGEIEDLEAKLKAAVTARADLATKLAEAKPLAAQKDIAALRTRLSEARTVGEVGARYAQRDKLIAEAQTAETSASRLTSLMEDIDVEMADAVARAVGRVPGLAFANERIELNGHPFSMASDAEQLEAAIIVAGLLNPTLRVVRVRDGSLMDEEAMSRLAALAEREDLQVWVERVDSSGAVGFVLEDGSLKGAAAAAPPLAATDEEGV